MKRFTVFCSVFCMIFSMNACGGAAVSDGPEWTSDELLAYVNRESGVDMSYAGPFYFGSFDGLNANSKDYSEKRSEKVDEILMVLDEGIDVLVNLDKKLKEQREVFAWYVQEIQKIDETTMGYTDKILHATNVNILSESLSNLLVLQKNTDKMEKNSVWGFAQFQKLGALVELTNLYTVEDASQIARSVALYYLLESDVNPEYQKLNVEFIAKYDPVADEVSDILNELYYTNAVLNYGEQVLFTSDHFFARDSLKLIDEKIANLNTTIAEYDGSNELVSEELVAILTSQIQEISVYRDDIRNYLDSIPNAELLVEDTTGLDSVSIFPVAYAQSDLPGYFQQKVKDAVKFVKLTKDMSMAAVRVTGKKLKDIYDTSGAHEAVKDGAQIINAGLEGVNSTVEVSIHGIQGIYYGDMTWDDFKKKIEDEKQELYDKFVQGKLGKDQYDEMINQVNLFQKSTGRFVDDMSELAGDMTGILSGQPKLGKFVKSVSKNVGDEAKKVLDTATDFTKNLAIVMHPETTKEDTRKALIDIYSALKSTKDEDGKYVKVTVPDIKELIKGETLKELGLSKDEEKKFTDELKEAFKDELEKEEETVKKVHKILKDPKLTEEEIADLIIAEIVRDLPPLNKDEKEKKEENKDVDKDGIENEYDNCEKVSNSAQTDTDLDGLGDACDPDCSGDSDDDGTCNELDNCPGVSNPDQGDADGDGKGNICDFDAPLLSEIAGTWPGSIKVTKVYISEELRNTEGCDTTEVEKSVDQVKPISITISPSGENGGEIIIGGSDFDQKGIPFTYVDGQLKAAYADDTSSINFDMAFSNSKSTGTMELDYMGGQAKISADTELSK